MSALKSRKNIPADVDLAMRRFTHENALAPFPTLTQKLVSMAEIVELPEGMEIQTERKTFERVLVPLTGSISTLMYTGLPFDESLVEQVSYFSFIGLIEVLEKRRSPMSVKADECSWALSWKPSDLDAVFKGEPELTKAVRLLISSHAISKFCRHLRSRNVSGKDLARLLSCIDSQAERLAKNTDIRQRKAIYFLQSGRVFFQAGENSFSMEGGEFFGASAFTSEFGYECKVMESSFFHFLDFDKFQKLDLNHLLPHLVSEPCFPVYASGNEVTRKKELLTGIEYKRHELSKCTDFGIRCRTSEFQFSSDVESLGYSTLHNWYSMLRLKVNARDLRTFCMLNTKMSPLRVAKLTERFGCLVRSLQISPSGEELTYPSMTFVLDRPVILLGVKHSQVYWLDPALGLVSASWREFYQSWTGQIIAVFPDETEDSELLNSVAHQNRERTAREFMQSMTKKVSGLMRNILFLECFGIILSLAFPLLVSHLFNESLRSKDLTYLPAYLVGMCLVTVFQVVSSFLSSMFQEWVATDNSFHTHTQFFRQYLSLAAGNSRVMGGQFLAKPYQFEFYQHNANAVASHLPSRIGFAVILLGIFTLFSWQVALFCLVGILVCGVCSYLMAQRNVMDLSGFQSSKLNLYERLTEFTTAFSSIKSYSIESRMRRQVERANLDSAEMGYTIAQREATRVFFTRIITSLMIFGAVYLAVGEYGAGKFSLASFIALSIYLGYLMGPVDSITHLITRFVVSRKGAETALPPSPAARMLNDAHEVSMELRGEVTFDKVSFRYGEKGPLAIQNISFAVKPGQIVAIVGRSGSGKTTLAKLISAQLLPTSGQILYDGFEVRELSAGSLRQQIGFVSQDLQLFSGSIMSNIAFDEDVVDLDLVKEVSKASVAHQFIRSLPNHYFYQLSENGIGLSAGQRHRISLARALYRKPKMLTIDEGTAYLDPESEKAVSDSISRLMNNKTIFLVVHRLYIARRADLIIVMKNGQIAEVGRHEELIKKNSEYTELYRHQVGLED